jgi:hypothetical protein
LIVAFADDFGVAGQPPVLRAGAAAAREEETGNYNAAMGLAVVAEGDGLAGGLGHWVVPFFQASLPALLLVLIENGRNPKNANLTK